MNRFKSLMVVAVALTTAFTGLVPLAPSAEAASSWAYGVHRTDWQTWGNTYVDDDYIRLSQANTDRSYVWRDYDISRTNNEWIVVSAWANVNTTQYGLAGRPYLYGYIFGPNNRIEEYMQGGQMMRASSRANEWQLVYGVFHRDADQDEIRLFLNQGQHANQARSNVQAAFLYPEVATYRTYQDAQNRVAWLKDRTIRAPFWNAGEETPYDDCWSWHGDYYEGYDCYTHAPELPIYAPSHRGQLINNYRLVKLADSPSIWMINHDTNTRHIFINEDIYMTWDASWDEYVITSRGYLENFKEEEPALPRGRYVRAEGESRVWWSSGERLYDVYGTPNPRDVIEVPWWMGNLYDM